MQKMTTLVFISFEGRRLTSLPPDGRAGGIVNDESHGGGAAGEASR